VFGASPFILPGNAQNINNKPLYVVHYSREQGGEYHNTGIKAGQEGNPRSLSEILRSSPKVVFAKVDVTGGK